MKKAYFVVLLVLLLFAAGCMESSGMTKREPMLSDINSQENSEEGSIHVNTETAIVDVINHPAFKGFGRFLFPTEHGLPDKEIRLNQIDSLLLRKDGSTMPFSFGKNRCLINERSIAYYE